jgi:hypothetical protein
MLPLLLVAGVFSSFGTGVLRPSLTSLVTQAVARNEQGVVLGAFNTSLQSVAQIRRTGHRRAGSTTHGSLSATWALGQGRVRGVWVCGGFERSAA